MKNIIENIENMKNTKDLIIFLNQLANDYEVNNKEWENRDIKGFLKAIASYIEDSSENSNAFVLKSNDVRKIARILYIGKNYK